MIRSLLFLDKDYTLLQDHLFKDGNEQAAYLLCGLSETETEQRFLVRDVIPVEDAHIERNSDVYLYYTHESYLPVITRAKRSDECFIMVHCHPNGHKFYSDIDDIEEVKLLRYASQRIPNKSHGSIVFSGRESFVGRIFNSPYQTYEPIDKIRIIGETYKVINPVESGDISQDVKNIYDRNILAFGEDMLRILQDMHIGIVGCGGTGSEIVEQLCRLGVRKMTLVDDDIFESTNVTRIHGSTLNDVGIPKVDLLKRYIDSIGLGTEVIPIKEKLNNKKIALRLRDCDIVFSCLDYTHFTRAILNLLSICYYIPIIDMGIKFDSEGGKLNDIFGRIDVVTPNTSCLLCRHEIDPEMISAELMSAEDYERLREEGYAKEIKKDKLQAIPYNTLISSYAVTEMIQLLTNFKGKNNYHTLYRFTWNKISTEGIDGGKSDKDCLCNSRKYLGVGDKEPFLGMVW